MLGDICIRRKVISSPASNDVHPATTEAETNAKCVHEHTSHVRTTDKVKMLENVPCMEHTVHEGKCE